MCLSMCARVCVCVHAGSYKRKDCEGRSFGNSVSRYSQCWNSIKTELVLWAPTFCTTNWSGSHVPSDESNPTSDGIVPKVCAKSGRGGATLKVSAHLYICVVVVEPNRTKSGQRNQWQCEHPSQRGILEARNSGNRV